MAYSPGMVPNDPKLLATFLADELRAISDAISTPAIEFRNVAPAKPREGMIYGADGTNWNPGSGKGVYCYYGGAWTKL